MRSNKIWIPFFALTLVAGACAKRGTPDNQPIQVKLQGGDDCISHMGREFSNYAEGKSSPQEIRAFWACLKSSVKKFRDLTAGDGGGDRYSPESLRQFIEHYFYTDKKIPGDVLAGLMQLKRVLLSGTSREVTRGELDRLDQLLTELNAITADLQPYAPVLFRKKTGASETETRAAARAGGVALARLGNWLKEQNQPLSFEQVASLANALANWAQENGKDKAGMRDLRQAAFVLPEVKAVLMAGSARSIDGSEWTALTSALARGLELYLAVANGLDANLDAALTRADLPEGANAFLQVLRESASRHATSDIPLSEFKNLYAKLAQTDWLGADIKPDALTAMTQWLLRRVLGDGAGQTNGLTLAQIQLAKSKLDDWSRLLALPDADPSQLMQDFNRVLLSSAPISWDAQGRMIFPEQLPGAWTADARRHMIWNYVVLRWLKDAYVGARTAVLTENDMNLAAKEVLPLLQNFGWLKSTKDTIGKRILREADLFTLASNGDGNLDLNEATRYLAFVMGSYRSAEVWLDEAKKICEGRAEAGCVRSFAFQSPKALAQMPRFQRILKTWDQKKFANYMMNAETTTLDRPETGEFTTGDLLLTYQLFEYVEVFLEIYDADHNDLIDLSEAIEAYKVYGPTLGRLLPQSDFGFFTFLLKYGDTPFTMFGGQIAYNHWRWHESSWSLSADRNILMSILSQLAKLSGQ